jgi:hypothetical protein
VKVPNPKLIHLLAYIWARMGEPRSATKMFWIAFQADFESYAQYGESISGAQWRAGRTCPLPVLR